MADDSAKTAAAPCPVVGVGASAGGLEALMAFVGGIPADCPLAFVVVQHLSPDYRSVMAELLSPHTAATVVEAVDGMVIEPATVYVMQSGMVPRIEGEVLRLDRQARERGLRTPIDRFFFSLADTRGPGSMCVVLSGTGSDGTMGVRAVKAAGGIAVAQDHDSARFAGMPDSAVGTGLVDTIVPPQQMAMRLTRLADSWQLPSSDGAADRENGIGEYLDDILRLLEESGDYSLKGYRSGTLIRRTARRMGLAGITAPEAYVAMLREDAVERSRLLDDFFVSVTTFFRDPDAFETLEKSVVPTILARDQRSLRVWVPGCSTGEEVYSIAMLFAEQMQATGDKRQLQIFGTDVDRGVLAHARAGIYSDPAVERLSLERRQRFLVEHPEGWKVTPDLQSLCVFAPHDVARDPPFSRLDLVSCRNLMIYLDATTQAEVLARLHYGLSSEGFLFLGRAETPPARSRYFEAVDEAARLYRREDNVAAGYSAIGQQRRVVGDRGASSGGNARLTEQETGPLRRHAIVGQTDLEAGQFYLHTLATPFCVVDRDDKLVHLSDAMTAMVRPSPGEPSANVEMLLSRDLRAPVREALDRARASRALVRVENVNAMVDGEAALFDVAAVPVPFGHDYAMVSLAPVRVVDPSALATPGLDADRLAPERDLALTRQRLADLENDYTLLEAEMQTGHESLLAMNEELQTTTQEMEASREELQSVNEELETINAELVENNDQLRRANSDLENLFDNSDVAVLFLDPDLKVRRYTRSATVVVNLTERDIGRPLSDLTSRLDLSVLPGDVEAIDRGEGPVSRELSTSDGTRSYLMRLRPYRTLDRQVEGYVLSFFDITEAKAADRQIAEQYAELETLYDSTPVGLALFDRELRWVRVNQQLAAINGLTREEMLGERQPDLLPDIYSKVADPQEIVFSTGEAILGVEVSGTTPADPDHTREWIVDYHPVKQGDRVFALGAVIREVTGERALRRQLEESEAKLRFALASGGIGMWYSSAGGATLSGTDEFEAILGETPDGVAGVDRLFCLAGETQRAMHRSRFDAAMAAGERWSTDFEIETADGARRHIALAAQSLDDQATGSGDIVGIVMDVTAQRASERQARLLLGELQHRVKNTLATILAIVRFTERTSDSASQMARSLEQRLTAISRTHDVLTRGAWRGERLRDLFDRHLQPYHSETVDRAMYTGPDIDLGARATLGMSLAFHELATNAAKYGALSLDSGSVTLAVERHDDGRVRIVWQEQDGPPVSPPDDDRRGFGSFLVERALAADLEGESTLFFDPEGVRCVISFREAVAAESDEQSVSPASDEGS